MLIESKTKFLRAMLVFMILTIVCGSTLALGNKGSHEHPAEHPSEAPKGESHLDKDEVADAIVKYVNETAADHDGYFVVTDDKTGEELKLTLDRVHRERLSWLGGDEYFACADFLSTNGKVYDLDVFMKGQTKDDLEYSKFTVHKVNGEARYTWYEKDGVWKKKYAEGKGSEHPESEHSKSEHPG